MQTFIPSSIFSVLIPRPLPDPLACHARVRADLDAHGLGRRHDRLHRLHQVLGVADQDLGGLMILIVP